MPERRFYAWHQPPTLLDRMFAHPGTTAVSIAGVLVGLALIAAALGFDMSGGTPLSALPGWVPLWAGLALAGGGVLTAIALLAASVKLDRDWRMERLGWTLQLGAWSALAVVVIVTSPTAFLTWPLLIASAATALLRLRALRLIEAEARRLNDAGGRR